ncbi:MAG: hypothetical protein CFH06_01942 [Alphaproteobacteria bacterium MarineAlpha3_Bin5]|nr:hypothetical protein [Magnetovibrio sp.]PPR75515.1 MAG: hypothetical protein CFH06_01942 [Alphaproteobacteria bacterium MarineAlpha3_Bin5]|tara:strand:- start:94 stop:402 length:309 start_codon:yes stop_codon:yes gene_type:complete
MSPNHDQYAMSKWNKHKISKLIRMCLAPKFETCGVDPDTIGNDADLFALGVLDSFGLIELLCEIEETTGLDANLVPEVEETPEAAITPSIDKLASAFFLDEN